MNKRSAWHEEVLISLRFRPCWYNDNQPPTRIKASLHVFVFRFRDSLESKVVTVVAICTNHRVSTYRLPSLTEPSSRLRQQSRPGWSDGDGTAALERRKSRAEPAKDSSELEGEEGVCVFVSPVRYP